MMDIVERMTRAGNDLTTLSESYYGQRQCGWFLEFAAVMREGRDEIERLQAALAKKQEPEGGSEERVAIWLRGRGYLVTRAGGQDG
jgi:hypothetical protein